MKIVVAENGAKKLILTRTDWQRIGESQGWITEAKKKKSGKKRWTEGTPYAICTKSIGKTEGTQERSKWSEGAEERYKRCKEHVKKQHAKK